jgi:hypothetical protein
MARQAALLRQCTWKSRRAGSKASSFCAETKEGHLSQGGLLELDATGSTPVTNNDVPDLKRIEVERRRLTAYS